MRFIVDAQLPPLLAQWLRSRGHEADHVYDLSSQSMPDRWIAEQARTSGAIVVTKDSDFSGTIAKGCAVVWLRHGNMATADLIKSLESQFSGIETALARGQMLVEAAP